MQKASTTHRGSPSARFIVLTPEQANQVSGGSKKKAVAPPPAPQAPPGGPNILPGDGGPSTPDNPFE
jgi:hypothetical protein